MHSFIGNKRYASVVCFEKEYRYGYKDDVISLIYMLLDITFGYLPWDKEDKPRQEYKMRDYYESNVLLELYEICLQDFSYTQLFERLGGRIGTGNT